MRREPHTFEILIMFVVLIIVIALAFSPMSEAKIVQIAKVTVAAERGCKDNKGVYSNTMVGSLLEVSCKDGTLLIYSRDDIKYITGNDVYIEVKRLTKKYRD